MLAETRADGASGICEPGTSDPTIVVDVDVDVDVDVAECDRPASFTADRGPAVCPHPVNAHTVTTAIMIAGRAGCLEIITRGMTPREPVRFHLAGTCLAVGLPGDELAVVEPSTLAPASKKRFLECGVRASTHPRRRALRRPSCADNPYPRYRPAVQTIVDASSTPTGRNSDPTRPSCPAISRPTRLRPLSCRTLRPTRTRPSQRRSRRRMPT